MRFASILSIAVYAFFAFGGRQASASLTYTPITTEDGLHIIVVSGEFTPDDRVEQLATIASANNTTVVAFDSGGGSVTTAMALGRMIRQLGLNTIQIRKLECASACSLAFLGGVSRIADPGSVGVHRTSFAPDSAVGRDEAVATVQQMMAEVLSYLSEMGVSAEFLNFSLRYDRSDIRYLSASEMADLKVTTSQRVATEPSGGEPEQASVGTAGSQTVEAAALDFIRSLIERDGADSAAAIQTVASFYADTISYYGKQKSLREVLDDKRRYFIRWPERTYRIRDRSVIVTCANGACMVSGVYDWLVRSLPRNKQAQGAARFSYTISLGTNPKIISETGNVMKY